MKKTKLIVKDNALIEASFNLSLVEQRLMLLSIVEAREYEHLNYETAIKISVKTYSEEFKINKKIAYKQLKEATETLFERKFSYYDKETDERLKSRWIHTASYIDDKGHVIIYLTPIVIKMIRRLEIEFTKYLLNHVSDFKSKYSVRLFEIISKWKDLGYTSKYSINDLRGMLGVSETEYKTMSLFKRNVLDKAVTEINKAESILFNLQYEQFKEGKSITHIRFKINMIKNIKKKQTEKIISFTEKQLDMFSDKLSKLPSFQNYYLADTGASTKEYAQQIKRKLSEPCTVKNWLPFLNEVGYKDLTPH